MSLASWSPGYPPHYGISFTKHPLGRTLSRGLRTADSESGVLCNIAPVVLGPAASASPRSLFWVQKLKPQPRPTESESAFSWDLQAIRKFACDQKTPLYNTW